MAAAAPKVFKISKKLKSDYVLKPKSSNDCQEYAVHIESHDSTDSPFMFLHEGTSTTDVKTAVGSMRRNPEDTGFEISSTGVQDADDAGSLTTMRKTMGLTAEMEVSIMGGKPRQLAWRPNFGHGMSCNLEEMTSPYTVFAKYEEDALFSRAGKLTLNDDLGVHFERVVIASVVEMFEKTSVWAQYHHGKGARYDAPIGKTLGIVGGLDGFAGAGGL